MSGAIRPFSTLMAMVVICALGAAPLSAQVAGGMGAAPAPAQSPAERVRASLRQAGITVCAPVIDRAAQFLFEDGDGNFVIQPLSRDVNRTPVVLTMESAHPASGRTRLTVVTIAPAGVCSGSYEQVISWTQSCDVLKTTVFSAFRNERPLFRTVRQSELSPGIQLYLMPAGTGCVSIKKELIG
jgi:hypothetical protein